MSTKIFVVISASENQIHQAEETVRQIKDLLEKDQQFKIDYITSNRFPDSISAAFKNKPLPPGAS